MSLYTLFTAMMTLLFAVPAAGQGSTINSAQAPAFVGTWIVDMSEPAVLVGTTETIRIWDKNGVLAASVQIGRFPPYDVTGVFKDGESLLLTTTLRENGQPIGVVISLKLKGETMMLAQMMEQSQTIKRGIGKK